MLTCQITALAICYFLLWLPFTWLVEKYIVGGPCIIDVLKEFQNGRM